MVAKRLSQWFETVAVGGRELMRLRRGGEADAEKLAAELLSTKGDAIGAALASDVVGRWLDADRADKPALLEALAHGRDADAEAVRAAWARYEAERGDAAAAQALANALENGRTKLFRRIAMAQEGVRALVDMRAVALAHRRERPALEAAQIDLKRLFDEWFNPGFLTLETIDWSSSASLLEKLIRYEAVNAIESWEDLRRRLGPDRRCFAFFHPTLPDEPLIFVQVALEKGVASDLAPLLDPDQPTHDPAQADSAIFYSISNCQAGLEGVRLGNFLIKQVAASLKAELPALTTFATLSPVPNFREWLDKARAAEPADEALAGVEKAQLDALDQWDGATASAEIDALSSRLCARYLLSGKRGRRPYDPVARFHLGNGASLDRINPHADLSPAGLRRSYGVLVNYRYDLAAVERNHQSYVEDCAIACAQAVKRLAA